jgi:hypothetical protein
VKSDSEGLSCDTSLSCSWRAEGNHHGPQAHFLVAKIRTEDLRAIK